jgi:hypothetical protein
MMQPQPGGGFIITPHSITNGHLLYLQMTTTNPTTDKQATWQGKTVDLFASMPVSRTLNDRNVNRNPTTSHQLILLTSRQSVLEAKRVELERQLGTFVIEVTREKTSFHPSIDIESVIDQLKDSIAALREHTTTFVRNVDVTLARLTARVVQAGAQVGDYSYHSVHEIVKKSCEHLCRVAFGLGVRVHAECIKFMTKDRAEEFSHGLVRFAIIWFDHLRRRNEKRKHFNSFKSWRGANLNVIVFPPSSFLKYNFVA